MFVLFSKYLMQIKDNFSYPGDTEGLDCIDLRSLEDAGESSSKPSIQLVGCFQPKIGGFYLPKWMVKIMGNPI